MLSSREYNDILQGVAVMDTHFDGRHLRFYDFSGGAKSCLNLGVYILTFHERKMYDIPVNLIDWDSAS